MEDVQRLLVADRIADLARDAEGNRTGRRVPDPPSSGGPPDPGSPAVGARVRLGRWLIGVGAAIESSGRSSGDRDGARRTA